MKIAKYFFVGGTSAFVDIAIFYLFAKELGLPYLGVSVLGFLAGTTVNYQLGIRLVFKAGARFSKNTEIALVTLVSAVGLILHSAVLYFCIDVIGMEMMLAKLSATGSVFFWNYLSRKYFVFKESSR